VISLTLTNEDLQAIVVSMQPLLQPIYKRLDGIDGRLYGIDVPLNHIDERLDGVDGRLDKLEIDMSAMKAGQREMRKDLKRLELTVSDTYTLALEAWGTSTENRKWLEESKLKA